MFVAFISCSFPFVVRADYGVGCPTVTRQVSQSLGQYVPRQSPTFCLLLDSVRYNREQGDRALVDHLVCIAVREAASYGEIRLRKHNGGRSEEQARCWGTSCAARCARTVGVRARPYRGLQAPPYVPAGGAFHRARPQRGDRGDLPPRQPQRLCQPGPPECRLPERPQPRRRPRGLRHCGRVRPEVLSRGAVGSWHHRTPEIAHSVTGKIRERLPRVAVEHVGSTAVPGCAGKVCLSPSKGPWKSSDSSGRLP